MTIRQKRILWLSVIVIVLGLGLSGGVVLARSRQGTRTTTAPTGPNVSGNKFLLTPAGENTGAYYTFEDGGTDGWIGKGHIVSVANSTTRAHDGTHSLKLTLYSSSPNDLPYVSVPSGSWGPEIGQTLTAYVNPGTGSTKVEAEVYVQDSKYQWHQENLVSLASGRWTKLSLTLSNISGHLTALGVQFLVTPANMTAVLYLDTIGWEATSRPTPTPTATTASITSAPLPTATTASVTRAPTPTPAPTSVTSGGSTFEDGSLDGWSGNGHVVSLTNSTAYAHDGTHSLKMVLYMSSPDALPYVSIGFNSGGPVTGEMLTMYLYVPGGSAYVAAHLYVQESNSQWYYPPVSALAQGQWVKLTLQIPSMSGSAMSLGAQFYVSPANTTATIYLDSVSW